MFQFCLKLSHYFKDLFHLKALEVGHIQSISLRLNQTDKEHSLTLDSIYVVHNSSVYEFNVHHIILNKQQAEKEFFPVIHETPSDDKVFYYIATHMVDKILSGTNASFQVVVVGSDGMFGMLIK